MIQTIFQQQKFGNMFAYRFLEVKKRSKMQIEYSKIAIQKKRNFVVCEGIISNEQNKTAPHHFY